MLLPSEQKKEYEMASGETSQPLSSTDRIIKQISEANIQNSQNDIVLDSQELKVLSTNREKSFAGMGEYVGQNAVEEALNLAISNTGLSVSAMKEVREVVVHFTLCPDITMSEIAEGIEIVHESVHADAEIFWGTVRNESLKQYYAKVMIVLILKNTQVRDR